MTDIFRARAALASWVVAGGLAASSAWAASITGASPQGEVAQVQQTRRLQTGSRLLIAYQRRT